MLGGADGSRQSGPSPRPLTRSRECDRPPVLDRSGVEADCSAEEPVRVAGDAMRRRTPWARWPLINGCPGRGPADRQQQPPTPAAEGTADLSLDHPAFIRHPWSFENVRRRPPSYADQGFWSADVRWKTREYASQAANESSISATRFTGSFLVKALRPGVRRRVRRLLSSVCHERAMSSAEIALHKPFPHKPSGFRAPWVGACSGRPRASWSCSESTPRETT